MPRIKNVRITKKTTHKTSIESIAILTSKSHSDESTSSAFIIGKEISRLGHITCVSELNTNTNAAISGVATNNGIAIGYLHTINIISENNQNELTHMVIPNTTYEHSLSMLFQATAATILIVSDKEDLKIFTQRMPQHQIVGALINSSDLSSQLASIFKTADVSIDNFILDSNPINLVQKIIKRLRNQQIMNLKLPTLPT